VQGAVIHVALIDYGRKDADIGDRATLASSVGRCKPSGQCVCADSQSRHWISRIRKSIAFADNNVAPSTDARLCRDSAVPMAA
jgi:hypothetical protein